MRIEKYDGEYFILLSPWLEAVEKINTELTEIGLFDYMSLQYTTDGYNEAVTLGESMLLYSSTDSSYEEDEETQEEYLRAQLEVIKENLTKLVIPPPKINNFKS